VRPVRLLDLQRLLGARRRVARRIERALGGAVRFLALGQPRFLVRVLRFRGRNAGRSLAAALLPSPRPRSARALALPLLDLEREMGELRVQPLPFRDEAQFGLEARDLGVDLVEPPAPR
jgi:hypothetical protein